MTSIDVAKSFKALAIDKDLEVDDAFAGNKTHTLAEILHGIIHFYPRHGMKRDGEVREVTHWASRNEYHQDKPRCSGLQA